PDEIRQLAASRGLHSNAFAGPDHGATRIGSAVLLPGFAGGDVGAHLSRVTSKGRVRSAGEDQFHHRRRRAIKSMILRFTLILLLTLLATSSFAQNNLPARTPARSERQKAAEEAADRVMHRFYETLDFGAIYKEMYVADPLKTAEVRWTIRGILMQGVFALPSQERPKTLNIDFAA